MSTEEIQIQKIENHLRGLRMGTKKLEDVKSDIETRLGRLKKMNPHMADDLEFKFIKQKEKLKDSY
jgi:hypothetical protein